MDSHDGERFRPDGNTSRQAPRTDGVRSENAEEVARDRSRPTGSAADRAAEAARRAREYGSAVIDQQKHRAAQQLGSFGSALRDTASRLQDERDATLAGYAEAAADKLNQAADYVRNRDANTMISDAKSFARRRPELVIGGMFIAGVALARFLKATPPGSTSATQSTDDETYVPHSKREDPISAPGASGEAPRFPSEAGTFQSPRGLRADGGNSGYRRPIEAAGGSDLPTQPDNKPDQPGTTPEAL